MRLFSIVSYSESTPGLYSGSDVTRLPRILSPMRKRPINALAINLDLQVYLFVSSSLCIDHRVEVEKGGQNYEDIHRYHLHMPL